MAIRRSRLFLVKQLAKIQANISILGLLVISAPHRDRFLNIFRKTFVDVAITPNRLENMVGRVAVPRVITFAEEEIPKGNIHNEHCTSQPDTKICVSL